MLHLMKRKLLSRKNSEIPVKLGYRINKGYDIYDYTINIYHLRKWHHQNLNFFTKKYIAYRITGIQYIVPKNQLEGMMQFPY